jgi:MoaA/NifB/PqqE/SkfB family radical SAM enzyme
MKALLSVQAHVATSVYAPCANTHDEITQVAGSFSRTINNLEKVYSAGIPVRAGFIEMAANSGLFEPTREFLTALGVSNIQFDSVRNFGRAAHVVECMSSLCGACAGNTACVSYDGTVYACIMSRKWPLGSLKDSSLADILSGATAASVRQQIFAATTESTSECGPQCLPGTCHPNLPGGCPPNTCHPHLPTPHIHRGN